MTTVTVSNIADLRTALANSAVTTILINPGNYTISQHDPATTWMEAGIFVGRDVTIKVNGTGTDRADFYAGANFVKGLFVVGDGADVTFDGIGFFNTRDYSTENVPGIRMQGDSLTVLNSYFENNNNGILGSTLPGNEGGTLVIDNSTFIDNGSLDPGGQEHHIYYEGAAVEVSDSYFEDSGYGHSIKIVASDHATITDNVIVDLDNHANSAIDSTGGGALTVTGNTITKSSSAHNSHLIYYETIRGDGDDGAITISNNIFNSSLNGTVVLGNMSNVTAVISNNQMNGSTDVFTMESFRGLASLNGNMLNGNGYNGAAWEAQATQGTSGNDTHILTNNSLYYAPSNFYNGGDGNDLILGSFRTQGAASDAFFGGAGNDTMSGAGGSDFLYGGTGDDILFSGIAKGHTDHLFGGDGNDQIYANARSSLDAVNWVYADGGSGNDLIDIRYSNGGAITGGRGNDILIGSNNLHHEDWINGGEGSDIIFGGLGRDTTTYGGGKSDTGVDTLVYLGAYGVDLTINADTYFPNDVRYVNALNDQGWDEVGSGESASNIEYIQFSNGSYEIATGTFTSGLMRVDLTSYLSQPLPHDPAEPYFPYDITAFNLGISYDGSTATAGAGNQTGQEGWGQTAIALGLGNDTYVLDEYYYNEPFPIVTEAAGEGVDIVAFRSYAGYVQHYTMTDNVEIGIIYFHQDTTTLNSITGNSGNNLIADYDDNNAILVESTEKAELNGGDGNDILYGGNGNDVLNGGNGTDTIVMRGNRADYTIGAGNSSITDNVTTGTNDGTDQLSGIEKIQFANGTLDLATNVFTTQSNSSTSIAFMGGTYSLLTGRYSDSGTGTGPLTLVGTSAAETLTGGSYGDSITGNGGNDTLIGNDGNDTFYYAGNNNGFDTVNGGAGYDRIVATANNTVIGLDSFSGIEHFDANGFSNVVILGSAADNNVDLNGTSVSGMIIDGGDGNDTLTVYGWDGGLYGGAGNDVINAGDGPAWIFGGIGNDTLNAGNGDDFLSGDAGTNILDGGSGTDTALYQGTRSQYSVSVNANGSYSIVGNGASDTVSNVENVTFSNGTFTISSLVGIPYPATGTPIIGNNGTAGNDRILTDDMSNTNILAGSGDDHITASGWNMNINAEDGNDVIDMFASGIFSTGGNGEDIFVFDPTLINVPVWDTEWATVRDFTIGVDRIALMNSAAINSFTALQPYMSQSGTSVKISLPGDPTITLENVNLSSLTAASFIFTTKDRNISGTSAAETINGTVDYDIITGGAGNDTLNGSGGSDTFLIGVNHGIDTINGGTGRDQILATADNSVIGLSAFSSIELISANGYNNVSILGSSGDNVFNFAGMGMDWINHVDGGAGNDTITSNDGWNVVFGGAGNDILYGMGGNDTLIGGAGNDTLNGGNDIDTVDYSAGTVAQTINLSLTSAQTISSGNVDTLISIENAIGGSANDTITGSSGNNRIEGNAGNDRMTGGAGNDEIVGGAGTTDTAVFAGVRASYTLSTNNGVTVITDNQATTDGNDGSDTLTQTERAEFKGGVIQAIAVPIILDLNGDGVSMVNMNQSRARFDWDGDGVRDQTGWMARGDGMLMIDRDGDGHVSGANELSFIDDKPGAKSDLDGLSAFDSNDDGVFSIADDEWGSFRMWIDRNGNGREDRNELVTLEQAGISAINLAATHVNRDWAWDENITINTGSYVRSDGSIANFGDVGLAYHASANSQSNMIESVIDRSGWSEGPLLPQRQWADDFLGHHVGSLRHQFEQMYHELMV